MKKVILTLVLFAFALSSVAFGVNTNQILAEQTAAAQSTSFAIEQGKFATVIFTGTVASGETADIEASSDSGTTWIADETQLTDTTLIRVIVGPGWFRINKGATAAAAGIAVSM